MKNNLHEYGKGKKSKPCQILLPFHFLPVITRLTIIPVVVCRKNLLLFESTI